jgi:hypothetical protein
VEGGGESITHTSKSAAQACRIRNAREGQASKLKDRQSRSHCLSAGAGKAAGDIVH